MIQAEQVVQRGKLDNSVIRERGKKNNITIDLQRIIAILLQVSERPKTRGELGLTREDVLELVKTGYFEWKHVIFPTERGREIVKWLLKGGREEELELFEAVKQDTIERMLKRGNRMITSIKMLAPIHIHIMQKIKEGQMVFYEDVERRAVKELTRWGLVKNVSRNGFPCLTRLAQELLTCFEEASRAIRLITCSKEVTNKR